MIFPNSKILRSIALASILSACSSVPLNNAPVVSGTNSSSGYGYNNGTVTTPYGTYDNGTVTTNSGYTYNNGTVTTPYGTVNSNNGTVNTSPYSTITNNTDNSHTDSNSTPAQDPAPYYTPNNTNPYTPVTNNTTVYTSPQSNVSNYSGNYSPVDPNATFHRVVSGDTVYNIAKRYNISQDNLRAWNHLSGNNIQLGQKLRVKPNGYTSPTSNRQSNAKTHRVVTGDTLYNIAKRYGVSQNQIRQLNNLSNSNIQLGQVLRISSNKNTVNNNIASNTPINTPHDTPNASTISTSNYSVKASTKNGITWQSPINGGKINQAFNNQDRRIEILGENQQTVVSAADGQVIFSGVGPRGYGNLVVVQHSPKYLTAYGNNEILMVKELQYVKRGQTLAKLSNTGKLHFEIREDGQPVNPAHYIIF